MPEAVRSFIERRELENPFERGSTLAAECIADIAGHILSGRFGVHPDDHEDAIRRLSQHGVMSRDLAAAMRGFGGFRNIPVRGYLRVDPARVRAHLEGHLGELRRFVAEVTAWLGGGEGAET